MTAARSLQDLTVDTIADALSHISADCSRERWARIGMALKSELGDAGFSLFDSWSRSGDDYSANRHLPRGRLHPA